MRLVIDLDMENDAFQEDYLEAARILRALSDRFERDGFICEQGTLRDINGNKCGIWDVRS